MLIVRCNNRTRKTFKMSSDEPEEPGTSEKVTFSIPTTVIRLSRYVHDVWLILYEWLFCQIIGNKSKAKCRHLNYDAMILKGLISYKFSDNMKSSIKPMVYPSPATVPLRYLQRWRSLLFSPLPWLLCSSLALLRRDVDGMVAATVIPSEELQFQTEEDIEAPVVVAVSLSIYLILKLKLIFHSLLLLQHCI